MFAIIDSKLYQTLAAHKFNSLGALAALVAGLGTVAYVSLLAQPDTSPATVIVVPQAPLIRAEPGSLRQVSLAAGEGTARPASPFAITRALQTRLTSAACYEGPINGQWTAASREAMRRFVSAANARLPVDTPDPVLLALVDSNPELKCSNAETATTAAADAPTAHSAEEPQTVATPIPSNAAASSPPLIRAPGQAPRPLAASTNTTPEAPGEPTSSELTSRLDSAADDVVVPAVATAAATATATAAYKPSSLVSAEKKKPRRTSYRNSKPARKKPSTIDNVSRSITKSVDSLQRSLGYLLN
ncbi:MAG: hypothetical protein IPL91_02880 [Hyphomicrobium sp.]|nr:hypothetical protein [Hyphomicrobium sp.]